MEKDTIEKDKKNGVLVFSGHFFLVGVLNLFVQTSFVWLL